MQQGMRVTLAVLLVVVFGSTAGLASSMLAQAQDQPVSIIFMHHSTGQGLIWQGGVREAFTMRGYEFWDHGYNEEGLSDPAGNALSMNWDVPGDNTDPDGWVAIFNQPVTDPPSNTFSHMLEYDVIIFKSCFPSSNITDEAMFEQYRRYYVSIRDVIDQHPDKLFIPFTTPPLVPNETDAESAARARRWAAYLISGEYLTGHPNIAVFDFFTLLADEDGYLRAEYRGDEWDSHPNERANRAVGPQLVTFVDQAVRDFMPEQAPPLIEVPVEAVNPVGQDDASLSDETDESEPLVTGTEAFYGVVQVDTDVYGMWDYTSDPVNAFACGIGAEGRDDASALVLVFDILPEGTAGCGLDVAPQEAWSEARGITFYARTDVPDLVVRVAFGVRDPAQADGEATPFDVELHTISTTWEPVAISWDDVHKADWYGEMGVNVFDPAQVVWLAFDLGYWDRAQVGTLWVDNITLWYD